MNNNPNSTEAEKETRFEMRIMVIVFFVALLLIVCFSVGYIGYLASEIERVAAMVNETGKVELTIKRNNLLSADYLAIVIPLMIALAGALVTLLGMNRLSTFDDRIEKIGSTFDDRIEKIGADLKADAATQKKAIQAEVQAVLQSDIEQKLNKQKKDIEDLKLKINSNIDSAEKEIEKKRQEINSRIADAGREIAQYAEAGNKSIKNTISSFETQYGWLQSIVEDNADELHISTVADAHSLVEDLRSKKPAGYMSMMQKIVDHVCQEGKRLSGNSDHYHNLSAELARGYLYESALRVLKTGLIVFPNDTDMLADTIEYATNGGFLEEAEEAVQKLQPIDSKRWSWRCYAFTIDYYISQGKLEDARKLCNQYKKAMPYDQHGYKSLSDIVRLLNPGESGINEAIKVLQEPLEKGANAPQCAQELANIYLAKGDYQDAIQFASRAIQESAQDQPSIRNASIFFKRGIAYDRLFMQEMSNKKIKTSLAEHAIQDYQMALDIYKKGLGELSAIGIRQIIFRITVLSQYLPDTAKDNEA